MVGLNGLDIADSSARSCPLRFALLIAALLVFVNLAPNTWQIKLRPRRLAGHGAGVGAALPS